MTTAQLLPAGFFFPRAQPTTSTVSPAASTGATPMNEERLPFTVKIVSSEQELLKAVQIRHAAYGRHVPKFAETLKAPEPTDAEDGVVVLLAESKLDGTPLGTMRIQTNAFKPLSLEQSIELPEWYAGRALAEATRLGITDDRIGRMVKNVLFKAFFLYCQQTGIEAMVIAGRSPIDRQYERLMFRDVYPGQGFIPLKHADNMPHRVMSLKVADVRPLWSAARHPLHDFFFLTFHEDINLIKGMNGAVRSWQSMRNNTVAAMPS